jgi:hypothetical protein
MLRQNQWFCQNNSRANGLAHGATAEHMGFNMEQQQSKWACTYSNSRANGLAHRATAEQMGLHIEQQQSKSVYT